MLQSLAVIDDFLADPEAFRATALRLNYAVPGPYPGRNSVEHINLQGLDRLVSSIVREPVRGMSPLQSHGHCRLALASDDQPGKIHIDPSDWSGILYLSQPEDCRGGTVFFRHKPTGTHRVPRDQAGLNAIGYSSYQDVQREIVDHDALDRANWEHTMTVPMLFNRLILLQPQYWHTSGPGFGDCAENGRLVYLMFFKRAAVL